MNYYYRDKAGQVIGPLTLDALAKLRFAGVLDGDTPVRVADSADWKPCREIIADPSHSPQSQTATTPVAKSPLSPVLIGLVIVSGLVYGGMTLYKSIAAKTTLTYGFFVDGKKLSTFTFQSPQVEVDGRPFASGNHLKPGRHQISISLENVEPYKQHFWGFYGNKNLGILPLESSKGSLSVTVNPSPATVVVQRGGEVIRQGDAPLNMDKLTVGDYELAISRGEYKETRSAKIQRNQRTKAQVDLNLGSVDLSADPADAEFQLSGNGRQWDGKLPAKIDEVPGGDYVLVIRRAEYEERHPVSVRRQQRTEARIELNLGIVHLSSNPADAEFELSGNGRHWKGKLPDRIADVPVGDYRLSVHRKGWELSADVSVGRGITATNKTEFPYGSIKVTSEPTGFVVSTNGVEIGKTPLSLNELKPGQYKLAITDGENDLTAEITVGPKEETKHAFVFHYGAARIASTPPGATVLRKGKEIGKTPLTLSRLPVGEAELEMNLAGYVSTNVTLHVAEGATANVNMKLVSERYLEAMQQARKAFEFLQFTESKKFVVVALEWEPNDTFAIRLRDEISAAEKKAEDSRKEAEKKAEDARKEAEERVNRTNEEARRKELAAQVAQNQKEFKNALSKEGGNEFFEIHTRDFPYSFETVWQAATSILRQKDKNSEVNAAAGFLSQKTLSQPGKGVLKFLGNVLTRGDYRAHWMLITPIDREITRVELKLFNYESADPPDVYAQIKTQNGQSYKIVQISSLNFGLVLDKDLVRRRAAEFFDEVEKAVRPSGVTPVAQNSSVKKPSVPESQKPDSSNQANVEAREVLEKVIAAHGGKERFRRVAGNKTVAEGDLYSDGVNKVKYSVISEYRKPGYLRIEYVFNRTLGKEFQVTEVNNLSVVSTRNGRAVPLDELSRQEWINRAKASRTLLEELEDPESVVTLLPPEAENASTVRVRSSNPDGDETIRYIDKSSWLIVKSEGFSVLNSKRVKAVTEFSDFMEFDGIKQATHEVHYYDNLKKADLRFTQCRYFFAGPE